jgi:GTP:adenosylcobinamide-phosphate guanylyltransferase
LTIIAMPALLRDWWMPAAAEGISAGQKLKARGDRMFNAVVLAGTGKPEPLTEQERVPNKAFIKIKDKAIITYVIQALCASSLVDKIAVVGPQAELAELLGGYDQVEIIPEKGSLLDNFAVGLSVFKNTSLCLLVTGDIPLITGEVIDNFIKLCEPHNHDLYYPVLTRDTCLKSFPTTERTYVRLKDGHITGGNIALINPDWFLRSKGNLEMFISYRKKPLKLMRLFPPFLIFKYLAKTLSVSDIERVLSKIFQLKAKAVFCEAAEIGVDVDKISDLELVRKTL